MLQVLLEGCDLSGKTSLFKTLWKNLQSELGFNIFLSDRSPMSILCYGEFYKRYDEDKINKLYDNLIEFLFKDNIIFYLKNDENIIRNRYAYRGDERSIEDIIGVKHVYDKYSEKLKNHINYFEIDASNMSIENISRIIIYYYNNMLDMGIYYKIMKYTYMLDDFGKINKNTKELVNINIKYKWDYKEFIKRQLNINDFSDVFSLNKYVGEDFSLLESYSYQYQINKFNKKVEQVLSGYGLIKEDVFSRKFVFTDDECLSFIQMLIRDRVLFVNVCFRSSNIVLLENDIKSIEYMVLVFLKRIEYEDLNKIKFNINISSLHKYI